MFTQITLPFNNFSFIRKSEDWVWAFQDKFGFSISDEKTHILAANENIRMFTVRKFTPEQIEEFRDFFEDEVNFLPNDLNKEEMCKLI